MSVASEHLGFHLANAFSNVHGTTGAALLDAVRAGESALLPLLGDAADHEQVAAEAYRYASNHKPSASANSSPPAARPTVVTEQMFRDRFGEAALKFGASDRVALARTLESELGIKPPKATDRARVAPVTRQELQAHFGAAIDLDKLSASKRLAASNSIIAARRKAS